MTPLLSARSLTKQYGGRNGCRNVSFDLYPGEVLCIVGESGSGKIHAAQHARAANRGRQRLASLHARRMATSSICSRCPNRAAAC